MQTISALDEHLRTLTMIERAGEGGARGPADRLVEVTERIEEQTALIRRDCVPWQIARTTVATTIVEATAAARCYHAPSFISAVLSRQEKDPRYIARSVEYLTHVIDYVSEHQPDDFATIERAEDRLAKLALVVRDTIEERVMNALGALPRNSGRSGGGGGGNGKKKNTTPGASGISVHDLVFPVASRQLVQPQQGFLNTPRMVSSAMSATPLREGTVLGGGGGAAVFSNLAVLEGLGDLCKKAHMAFEDVSEEQFANTIPNLILSKIRSILDPCFDARYGEEFEPWVVELQASGKLPREDQTLPASYVTRDINVDTTTDIFDYNILLQGGGGGDGGKGTRARSRRAGSMAGGGATGQRKHYRKGTHGLLKVSELARHLVLEVSEVLERFLIAPLEDDVTVVELPDRIASAVFRGIMKHAKQCIYVAERLMEADPTVVFIATGGAGPGVASMHNARNLRDAMFIGLDLLEELWQWRNHVAANLRGTHYDFDQLVEDELREYCTTILDMLNHYRNSKGQLDEAKFIEDDALRLRGKAMGITEGLEGFTMDSATGGGHGRRSWFPSPDCSAHESTINLIYLLRTLFVDYFGSLKLVLSDGDVASSDPEGALEAVKAFVDDCVEGHIHDVETIGDASAALQRKDQEGRMPDAAQLAANARKMSKAVAQMAAQQQGLNSPMNGGARIQSTVGGAMDMMGGAAKVGAGAVVGGAVGVVGGAAKGVLGVVGLTKPKKKGDSGGGGSGGASGSGRTDVRINPPIFALNNLYYLSQNLQQHYFTRRTQIVVREIDVTRAAATFSSGGGGGGPSGSGANAVGTVPTLGGMANMWTKLMEKQQKVKESSAAAAAGGGSSAADKKKRAAAAGPSIAAKKHASNKAKSEKKAKKSPAPRAKASKHPAEDDEEAEEDEEWEEEEGEEDEEVEEEEAEEEAEEHPEEGGEGEDEDEEDAPLPTTGSASANALVTRKRTRRVKVPLLDDTVEAVKERGGGWILAYRQCWEEVFPIFNDRAFAPEEIYAVYMSSAPFTSPQREAVKLHHQLLCCMLTDAVNDGLVHIMSDPLLKTVLIEQAVGAVEEGFRKVDASLVKGRPWTVDVSKYLGRTQRDWVSVVKGIL